MSNVASTPAKHKKVKPRKTKTPEDSGKNEGVDLNWAYQPPPGAKLITTNEDNGEFDWDAVKDDDDVEVWVLRVPDNVSSKDLEGLSLDLSASSVSMNGICQTNRIGTLKRKNTSYDVWLLGDENEGIKSSGADVVGGEELRSLSCLLPRKSKNGKLYQAPKPIAKHLVVSARLPASATPGASSALIAPHTNPPRHKYSPERLTHRFLPYGALVDPEYVNNVKEDEEIMQEASPMEVDASVHEEGENKTAKKKKGKAMTEVQAGVDGVVDSARAEPKTENEKKGKKRKGDHQEGAEGSYQKKPKKVKTTSS